MNILIFGRGVIGTLYGWALAKAGHSVEFYVRPGRAAQYGSTITLNLLDARTRMQGVQINETLSTRFVEEIPTDHNYDLIVVSVQQYRFLAVASFLAERLGNATVLIFQNFWSDPQAEASALPANQLVWGFPRAGGGFGTDGVLTGALLKSVMLGHFCTRASSAGIAPIARELEVRSLFKDSGFGIQEQYDFQGWLWFHYLINVGLLGQALKAGSLSQMVGSDAHLYQAVLNVRELLPILAARGVDFKLHAADLALFRIPPRLAALMLKLVFKLSAVARVVAQTAVSGEALARELQPMRQDVLDEARRLGIAVPRLEALEAGGDKPLDVSEVRGQTI
jgi:2-dehydropantoate 2-reductase